MKKIIFIVLCLILSVSYAFSQEPENIKKEEQLQSIKRKSFYIGFELGAGFVQTMIPDEFTSGSYLGALEAESKVGFAFDIGINISWYFTKIFGLHAGVGYDYNPFHMEGNAGFSIPGVSGSGGSSFPGYPDDVIPSFETWSEGYLKGKIHYLYIKLGPSLRINNFFFHLDIVLAINLSAKYEFDAEGSGGSLSKQGDYDEAKPVAIGIILQPGWRFNLGKLHLPVSLEFRMFLSPIGETNIKGIELPEATIKTWTLKIRVGLEL